MPANKPFRALIWDMGGVLVRNMDPSVRGRLAAPYGMTHMDLENLFFGSETAFRASIGQANEADCWEYVRQRLNLQPEELHAFSNTFWSCDRLDEDLFDFTMQLRPSVKIGLLSNAFPEARNSLRRRFPHFFEMFDESVISAEVGMAKPDTRIYHLVLSRLGVEAQQAIFVDDFVENIEAARTVGITAIQFRSASQAMADIKELLA